MADNPITGAPYYEEGMSLGWALINETTQRLAWLAQPIVQSITENDADAVSPSDGQCWYVASGVGAGDAWEGHEGDFALYYAGWLFIENREGQVIRNLADNKISVWDGSGWDEIHDWT